MNQDDLQSLRLAYHLQIHYSTLENPNEMDFCELPDDFTIDDVNNSTGEVTLSSKTIKMMFLGNDGNYYSGPIEKI